MEEAGCSNIHHAPLDIAKYRQRHMRLTMQFAAATTSVQGSGESGKRFERLVLLLETQIQVEHTVPHVERAPLLSRLMY